MPPPKSRTLKTNRTELIQSISAPLGFYVLALLIIEANLAIVLSCSKLSEEHVWYGLICMLVIFVVVVVIVSLLAWLLPKHLLGTKEEHFNPALDPGGLKDAMEQLIEKNVKAECLKTP